MKIGQRILELLHEGRIGGGVIFVCSCANTPRWQRSSCFKAQCHAGGQVTRGSVTPILQAFQLYVYTRALISPLISSAYVYHHYYIKKRLHTRIIKPFNIIFFMRPLLIFSIVFNIIVSNILSLSRRFENKLTNTLVQKTLFI